MASDVRQQNVITDIVQVTPAWLTSVLANSGALTKGAVISFETQAGRGNWSTNTILTLRYEHGSQGALPRRLFLKMVNANMEGESFDSSEVTYYTRDYRDVDEAPLVRCYSGAFSEELRRYHLLLDDVSETHITAADKAPTLEYGLALAEGLAAMHARWWGAPRFSELGAAMHTAAHIQRFVGKSEAGAGNILNRFAAGLEPHWPDLIRSLFAKHPPAIIARTQDDHGFTLVHGDVGHHNVMVPRSGDRPIYIIDRQPFAWSLTTWLGVYDLVYAMVLDWDVDTRRSLEIPVLRRYHDRLIRHGVSGYSWDRLFDDYRLCAAMGVYVAAEYFSADIKEKWLSTTLLMLRRSLTACDDLNCSELW
jgi:hypothetical protein